jgi:hypothetical protein
MPAKPTWLHRVPEIVQELKALAVPVVDRTMFERLFRVRRRRAVTLMQQFGALQTGHTLVVERLRVISSLERIQYGREFEQEQQRKQKLSASLDELHRHRRGSNVVIPPISPELRRQLPSLPLGVRASDGQLAIEFNSVEQLLQRLYELSAAAADDFDRFTEVVEAATPARLRSSSIPALSI